ncbi:MAG TPA: TylF/MycF/NovP-related O-methyltransferase [Ignavibacteria bacterium]|nr:TylF/MycF/NovP-related O-methyltransferase [Ignavibacteria bacterium]HMR38853.1 TylF/MycF/NovP-related O-methyltransferase [Ignavibacteria bacterium]
MIELPDFEKTYEYENFFYWTCDTQRVGKLLAHYELFKLAQKSEGAIVECGVFKGASLIRFSVFRKLFPVSEQKKIIGFDSFAEFPHTEFEPDKEMRVNFVEECGDQSISTEQLMKVLAHKNCDANVELVAGDITGTIPEYLKNNPDLKISLLNLDADLYEPSVTILENFFPRLSKGGVLILDDYGVFPGETKAADDYFKDMNIEIKKFPFSPTPSYLIKE